MKIFKDVQTYVVFVLILSSIFLLQCGGGGGELTEHWAPPASNPGTTIAPSVGAVSPIAAATTVCVNKTITATFSKAMLAATITAAGTFTVQDTTTSLPVAGIVTYDPVTKTATFTITAFLTVGDNYTATITTAATDTDGIPLAANKVWSFITNSTICAPAAPGSCAGPGPLNLGSAATYAVLAGTAFNFANPQVIIGDVGSPSITPAGGPSSLIGTMRDAGTDPSPGAIQTAVTDMQTAFNCATVIRSCDPGPAFNFVGATDFAALPQPLAAGHYCVTGAMSVGSVLTLTNPGVYIFQSTGALDTAVGPFAVSLAGAANPTNTTVYWVPGGITTIQANVTFLGSILSNVAAITLNANSTLIGGRALSGAAVNSLSTNTITIPIP